MTEVQVWSDIIEQLRAQLHRAINVKPLSDATVLALSEKLDHALNAYAQAKFKECQDLAKLDSDD